MSTLPPYLVTKAAHQRGQTEDLNHGLKYFPVVQALVILFVVLIGGNKTTRITGVGLIASLVVPYIICLIIDRISRRRYRELAHLIIDLSDPDEYQAFLDDELQYGFEATSLMQLPPRWREIVKQRAGDRLVRSLIDRAAVAQELNDKIRNVPNSTTSKPS